MAATKFSEGVTPLKDFKNERDLPEIIAGSELQLDGDICCYYNAWLDISLGQCIKQLKQQIEEKRLLGGYEVINVHTTQGAKAGREETAKVCMYQDARAKTKDPEKQARVKELRMFLQTYESPTVKPYPQFEVEADDSMSWRQRELIAAGRVSAICTKDKDLNMVPGDHHEFDSMDKFFVPDGYGKLWLQETQVPNDSKRGYSIKRLLKGVGTSFFWAQLLMGDKADSVPGLPKLPVSLLNKYRPTKAVDIALEVISNPRSTRKKIESANRALQSRKPAPIGDVTAYEMLKKCKTDQEAHKVVTDAYKEYYGDKAFTFEDWRGDRSVETFGTMFLEQAKLLWMLRSPTDSVNDFLREVHSGERNVQK